MRLVEVLHIEVEILKELDTGLHHLCTAGLLMDVPDECEEDILQIVGGGRELLLQSLL